MKIQFKNFELEDTLYTMVSEYSTLMCLEKSIDEYTKEEMNELLDDVFEYHKRSFNCYESIRAKIRNKLTPVVNAKALLDIAIRTCKPLNMDEMKKCSEWINLSVDGLLGL